MLFSYINAAIAVFGLLSGASPLALVIVLGGIGAFGIANERRWGYYLCIVAASCYLVIQILLFFVSPFIFSSLLNLLFSVFLMALLLHPMSRSFQRIYFH